MSAGARPYDGHLFLVGLPGAGKSTCARLLSQRLGRPAIDLDEVIEREAGRSVPEIFAELGEVHFRALEHEATVALVRRPPAIVSPGGGWVENPANVAAARERGRVVYLRVSAAAALARLGESVSGRPLLRGGDPLARMQALLARRRALYEDADAVVDTEGLNPQQVTELLRELALRWGAPIG